MQNIRFLIVLIAITGLFFSCQNEEKIVENYTISGEFRGATEGQVYIKVNGDDGLVTLDSTNLVDGKFTMSGHVDEVEFVYLTSKAFRGGLPLFLENTNYEVSLHKDSLKGVSIAGSETQKTYIDAGKKLESLDAIWQDFYYNTYRFMTDDEKAQNEAYLNNMYDSAQITKKDYLIEYVNQHNTSLACVQILLEQEEALGTDNLLSLFEKISPEVKATKLGNKLNKRIEVIKSTAIGQPLVDFVMNDTVGNPIKLSEVTAGKYVLVDFWAAWCGPCRRENPNVVENYHRFHDKGFDVLGVSFDDKKDQWLKAIKDDQLPWMQLSDLKGWDNAAGKLYGIRSIPQNILLSPEGIILEKNLRGEDLGAKLEEIFGK